MIFSPRYVWVIIRFDRNYGAIRIDSIWLKEKRARKRYNQLYKEEGFLPSYYYFRLIRLPLESIINEIGILKDEGDV